MIKNTVSKWIPSLVTAIALTGLASFCHAQAPILLSNDSSQSTAFYDGFPQSGAVYTWQATGGPNGGGCIMGVINQVTNHEFDPAFNVSFPSSQYYQVTVQMKVDSASGTTGTAGSGGYGNIQLSFRDASYSWNGVGYHTIFPPAANDWVTYVFNVPGGVSVAHLQLQLQAGGDWSGPVTIYIGNVTILPNPNPWVMLPFTNNAGINANWDSVADAPYRNPITGASSSITPPGSWQLAITDPGNYGSWNQIDLPSAFDTTKYQYVGFDVYLDGSSGSTYGGMQLIFFKNNYSGTPNTVAIGPVPFSASMVGKWTHFDFPCSASGITACPAIVIQGTPGSDGGTDTTTFHIDNVQLWNPVFIPSITSLSKGTPGGVQMTLDGNGTLNPNDQEGITSPATNNTSDFFWINQTPATYSFTLTNFPSPASAPSLDAHIYLNNGDSLVNFVNGGGGNGPNLWNYNQTYSGAPYNMVDYLGLHVQNGTNGGVVAVVDWKTNAPNSNATNVITFNFPSMPNANGTWQLTFSDNTHGSVIAADGTTHSFTLPDFSADPNYNANFTPATSMLQFGIFKNGNVTNNNQTFTITSVAATNSAITLFDNFSGPGLTANNDWQVAEYYQYQATRAIWQPWGTAYWLKWNTSASGWGVQASSNLLSGWSNAGVTYTYSDGGTNTFGAVPTTNLPAGNSGFFRLAK